MEGKNVVITGATSGIGAVTARRLVALGARVVLIGRDTNRAQAILATIQQEHGSESALFLAADLSSQTDICRLADEIARQCPRLDVLINNAGAMFGKRQLTVDGIEQTFAVNHLAYVLLTRLLLDRLVASAPSRIVIVASGAHKGVRLKFTNLQGEHGYNPLLAYKRSKLCNLYFTYELARRLNGTGVTVNALHPGFVATRIGISEGFLAPWLWRASCTFAVSEEEGARTSVHLASAADVVGINGRYFYKCREVTSSQASYDRQAAAQLWDISDRLIRPSDLPPWPELTARQSGT